MTRRHHYHDFPSATGDPVYRVSFDCHSAAERDAVRAAGLAVVAPAAFVPALSSGPAFDSPEVGVYWLGPKVACAIDGTPLPPNCGLPPSGYAEVLAHAQHTVAEGSDDECSSGRCLIAGSVAVQTDNTEKEA
jgi:hypothetical protein